jgi:hypothetical protein
VEAGNANRWERPDAPLGTLVFRAGLLSKEKLEAALEEGARSGRRLGEILLQKGWIDEKDLARLLAGQKSLSFVSLAGRGYDAPTARLLSERVCRYHTAIPIEDRNDRVVVAIADPTDDGALQEIRDELGRDVDLVVATGAEITAALDDVFHPAAGGDDVPGATPTAISPVSELGLRIAAPLPKPEAEPAPAPEAEVAPEPEPEPEPVAVEPEPFVLEPEPVAVEPELVAVEPEPEPVAAEPEPEPVRESVPSFDSVASPEALAVEPEPVAVEPEPVEPVAVEPEPTFGEPTIERNEEAHVSVAFHSAPPVTPEPEPVAEVPAPSPEDEEGRYRIALCLEGGDEIDVASFADEAEAEAAARELIAGIAKDGEWPRVGNQFIRPERIVSVDIRERQRFGGSSERAAGWGSGSPAA